jgi:hypothetical protein
MILNDDEVKERIESPLNLLNRLRSSLGHVTHKHGTSVPALPPKADEIIDNLDDKINNSAARTQAMDIMLSAMTELKAKLPQVEKPERLATIAHEMSKIITHQDTVRGGSQYNSQIIVYAPQVQKLDDYEIIDVVE